MLNALLGDYTPHTFEVKLNPVWIEQHLSDGIADETLEAFGSRERMHFHNISHPFAMSAMRRMHAPALRPAD